MSYLDQSRRRNPASVAAVVGVHLAVGYALLVGLGYTVIPYTPHRTIILTVPTEPPPPPPARQQQSRSTKQTVTDPVDNRLVTPPPIVPPPAIDVGPTARTGGGDSGPIVVPPLVPDHPSQAANAVPEKNWRNWITTDDYPTAALRQEIQGTVIISVMIGTDGRVRSCLVTQSSGSKLLDDATCRLYSQRARFTPARDADGNPIPAQRTDRYHWQIPNE